MPRANSGATDLARGDSFTPNPAVSPVPDMIETEMIPKPWRDKIVKSELSKKRRDPVVVSAAFQELKFEHLRALPLCHSDETRRLEFPSLKLLRSRTCTRFRHPRYRNVTH